MPGPDDRPTDLPEFMTWEELEQLPKEISDRIELWDGRVMWMESGSPGHHICAVRMMIGLERAARQLKSIRPEECWRAVVENDVHIGPGLSDFMKPDFSVFRCQRLDEKVWAEDVLIVGEVLSPSNTPSQMASKKARYAAAGIRSYWEIELNPHGESIDRIGAFELAELTPLPTGVTALSAIQNSYNLISEWTPADNRGVIIDQPIPIQIPWSELEL